jgi:sec-independent protein translocase protein TatA
VFQPSPTQLILLLVIILLLFGAKRLPEVARGLGRGIREFSGSLRGEDEPRQGIGADERETEG